MHAHRTPSPASPPKRCKSFQSGREHCLARWPVSKLIAGIATGSRDGLGGGDRGGGTGGSTKRGCDAQLPIVKSAEPSGVGVSAFCRPNGRTVPLPTGVWLNLITSLSESRNSSRPVVGMMMELRRPRTSSEIRKNVPCGFSFRSNVICFRSTRRWDSYNCVSIADTETFRMTPIYSGNCSSPSVPGWKLRPIAGIATDLRGNSDGGDRRCAGDTKGESRLTSRITTPSRSLMRLNALAHRESFSTLHGNIRPIVGLATDSFVAVLANGKRLASRIVMPGPWGKHPIAKNRPIPHFLLNEGKPMCQRCGMPTVCPQHNGL